MGMQCVRMNTHDWLIILSKVAEVPIYSFEKHARLEKTTTIYSPHVLILEGRRVPCTSYM